MKKVVYALCVAVAGALMVSAQAHAAPNQGPDPSDFTDSSRYGDSYPGVKRTVDYAVATSSFNTILKTTINVYVPTATATVVVHNQNICYNTFRNGGRNYDQLEDNHIDSSGNAVSFKLDGVTQWGAFDGSSTCDSKTLTFTVNGATLDPNTGLYKYQLVASANPATDKYNDTFWITAPAGSYISQDSSQPTSSFGMEQTSPIPPGNNPEVTSPPNPYVDYTNYLIRFAPDCTLNVPSTSKTIEIFDDDNKGNLDVQPRPFLVKLLEIDDITGASTTVPLSFTFPDGFGSLSGPSSGYYTAATTTSGKRIVMTFTVHKGKKYQWLVDSVYYDNTLQFKTPYDSVFFYTGCAQSGTLKAGMTATPSTMSQDDTATFTPSIGVSNYGGPFSATCSITRTFYPVGGGSSSLGSQPCVTTSGSSTIPITGNGTITLKSNTYSNPAAAVPGSRICDTITITNPTGPAFFASPSDNTSTSCVVITKTPLVTFLGGDVWAGGGFASVSPGTCNTSAKITTSQASSPLSDGTQAGSGVTYAAFALDKISNFGSASHALSGGVGDAWTFSNINAGNLGFFGAPQHCIADYSALFTGATTVVGSQIYDVGTRGSGTWHVTGNLTIHGTMPSGSRQVYVVDGTVSVDAPLVYPASYANAASIPSLVVITKKDFEVATGVAQMDGIFEAIGDGTTTGLFHTCWPQPPQETVSTCATALTVNGSVMTGSLDLLRTAGATGSTPAQRRAPAEAFNLSPELYLTNALNSNAGLTITSTRELPPRF